MKGFIAFLLCLAFANGHILHTEYEQQWQAWKTFYEKKYSTDTEEEARYAIWRDNLRVIMRFKSRNKLLCPLLINAFFMFFSFLFDFPFLFCRLLFFSFSFFKYWSVFTYSSILANRKSRKHCRKSSKISYFQFEVSFEWSHHKRFCLWTQQ